MIRKFFVASAALMLLTAHSQAALIGSFVLDQAGLAASDGGGAITVDTYKFDVASTEAADATSVELDFSLTTWAIPGINAGFRTAPALPQFLGQNLADSFFVTDGTQLVGNSEDTASRLYGAYTYPGTKAVIPAGGTATLAYLTVPAGTTPGFTAGSGAVLGEFVPIMVGGGLEGTPPSGTDLSEDLQGAFANRNFGPVMFEVMIGGNDTVASMEANGAELIDKGDGKYDILVGPADGDFSGFAPGTVLSGDVSFIGELGGDSRVDYSFSITVPEPSTVALTGLALIGLVGFARRRG